MSRRNDLLDGKVYVGNLPEDATSQEVFFLIFLFNKTFYL